MTGRDLDLGDLLGGDPLGGLLETLRGAGLGEQAVVAVSGARGPSQRAGGIRLPCTG
ncbi:hypothetical protein ACIBU0_36970 [Streptomyces sp. NPDC049627]|uniref:hypothetical protein n=1 Tax=Streptomyces sp. NPDC049627 TaxID=3365595 RepID=UPI0037BC57AD